MLQCTDDVLSAYLMVVVFKCNEEWGVGNRGIGWFVQIHLPFSEPLLQHLQITILQRSGVTGQSATNGYECFMYCKQSKTRVSLVPRPHPLTRRNGLVNPVEFLGLVPAFATM